MNLIFHLLKIMVVYLNLLKHIVLKVNQLKNKFYREFIHLRINLIYSI